MGISADDVSNIFRAENPQLLAIFRHLGNSIFLIIIRQCRDCCTARLRSYRSENHPISKFPEEFKFRQRWNQTQGLLPVLPVPNFILAEVLTKSSTLKQLSTFGLGLGRRSDKRNHISSFLALPVSEKHFPGSSGILLSRDIPKFCRGRTFSSSKVRI